ncbi:TerB family tellurite resistance protein [bacterium SCSIO 12741]|nr:TerB family tellurite resistance protein [bacterium SCSIO 12741]
MLQEVKERYKTDEWDYEDFLAFTLMFAAYSDLEVHREELRLMKTMVGEGHFEIVEEILGKLNDYDRIQLLTSFKDKFFPTDDQRDKMLEDMKRIFLADGQLNQIEQIYSIYLKRIL